MSEWLGIGILLVFSVGLSLFMRLEGKEQPRVPDELRVWHRQTPAGPHEDTYVERRVVQLPSRGFKAARWVEQRRVRRSDDDTVVEVLRERPFRPRV